MTGGETACEKRSGVPVEGLVIPSTIPAKMITYRFFSLEAFLPIR